MAYRVELSESADRELGKLDGQYRKRILKFLQERVAKLDDPRSIGKARMARD
jgi:mRNA interferase RelE/StbE